MKLVCYLQFGLGDFYDLICIMPEFIKKKHIDEVKFYVDSVYFVNDSFEKQKLSAIKMIETITNNWEVVPENLGSYRNLYYDQQSDKRLGPQYEKIKNTFMFYRRRETAEYIKSKIRDENIFVYGFMCKNFTFEWRNNTNVHLDIKVNPLKLPISDESRNAMDKLINEYQVLLQIRKKGNSESDVYFNNLYKCLIDSGLSVLCINLDNVNIPHVHDFNWLQFEELMYTTENIKYVICSSSVLGCHRIHFNKKTIINTPYRSGSNEIIFTDYIKNPNYLFLDSDIDNLNLIKEEVGTWKE